MMFHLSFQTSIFIGLWAICMGILVGVITKWNREITPADPTAKLCRDCHWIKKKAPQYYKLTFAKCMHPSAVRDAGEIQVSGVYRPDNMSYCSTVRNSLDKTKCGVEGQFWEAKK